MCTHTKKAPMLAMASDITVIPTVMHSIIGPVLWLQGLPSMGTNALHFFFWWWLPWSCYVELPAQSRLSSLCVAHIIDLDMYNCAKKSEWGGKQIWTFIFDESNVFMNGIYRNADVEMFRNNLWGKVIFAWCLEAVQHWFDYWYRYNFQPPKSCLL